MLSGVFVCFVVFVYACCVQLCLCVLFVIYCVMLYNLSFCCVLFAVVWACVLFMCLCVLFVIDCVMVYGLSVCSCVFV